MTTQETDFTALITYSVTEAGLAEIQKRMLPMVVSGIDDEAGYVACKDARKELVSLRQAIEKRRKELKEDSLKFGRMVDAEAKKIREALEAVEEHLTGQLKIVDDEAERRRTEKARKLQDRVDRLAKYGAPANLAALKAMSDENFAALEDQAREMWEAAEQAKQAEKERLAKAEAEQKRLDAENKAKEDEAAKLREELLESKRKELEAQAEELRKSKAREVEAEKERQAEVERVRKEEAAKIADAERARVLEERKQLEAKAAADIQDRKLLEEIKALFPTLDKAWVEIARLTKLLGGDDVEF